MKKKFKILGFIALIAVLGFMMISCDYEPKNDPDPDPITVTINGNFSAQSGREAWIAFTAPGTTDTKAYAKPLDVTSSTTSLKFSMLDFTTDNPFYKAGSYDIVLWFEKEGYYDIDFIERGRNISEGGNSIQFTSFIYVYDKQIISYGVGKIQYLNTSTYDWDSTVYIGLYYQYDDTFIIGIDCKTGHVATFTNIPAGVNLYFITTDKDGDKLSSQYFELEKGKTLNVVYDGSEHFYPMDKLIGDWIHQDGNISVFIDSEQIRFTYGSSTIIFNIIWYNGSVIFVEYNGSEFQFTVKTDEEYIAKLGIFSEVMWMTDINNYDFYDFAGDYYRPEI